MGERQWTGFSSSSPPTVDLALDSIGANDMEREVVHRVCRVDGARSALRVVAQYRAARRESTQLEVGV